MLIFGEIFSQMKVSVIQGPLTLLLQLPLHNNKVSFFPHRIFFSCGVF